MEAQVWAALCSCFFLVTASSFCVLCGEFPGKLRDHSKRRLAADTLKAMRSDSVSQRMLWLMLWSVAPGRDFPLAFLSLKAISSCWHFSGIHNCPPALTSAHLLTISPRFGLLGRPPLGMRGSQYI